MDVYGPLDDANLKAIARGVDACDGGRRAGPIPGARVVHRVGGVHGRRAGPAASIVIADEDEISAAGVFFGHKKAKGHR